MKIYSLILTTALTAVPGGVAIAQTAGPEATQAIGDIIVTAQKRSQSINSVGMSINAATGESLQNRGITGPADLGKVVPGFIYTPSPTQTPVYTLRGIGFYDSTLASSPAVTVYVDEIPLTFPAMTTGAGLDIERVEVLKGPQGTLFGSNSTGGAINYIAAKPTDNFQAGGNITVERFGHIDATAFVSGPLSNNLNVRVSGQTKQGGAWQYSQTRPDDKLGNDNEFLGRILLDWRPTDRLKVSINVNGFSNKSDTQGFQLTTRRLVVPALATPLLINAPFAPDNARAADWGADNPMRHDDRFVQGSVRLDYEITDQLTLTSISAYSDLKVDTFDDTDGTAARDVDNEQLGRIKEFDQELRLSGNSERLHWILGGFYNHSKNFDETRVKLNDNTIGQPLPFLPRILDTSNTADQKITNYAAFGNVEYGITDRLTAQAGVRYTNSRRNGHVCNADPTPLNAGGQQFTALSELLTGTPSVPVGQGECFFLNSATLKTMPDGIDTGLKEDNVSWRIGLNYKFDTGALVYANVSRGYKAGAISSVGGAVSSEYIPVRQEKVDAYEAGFKTPLFDRTLFLNAAAFYYGYRNKQIRGSILDPVFGTLEALINVPKSRVWGLEGNVTIHPAAGLDISGGVTYVNTRLVGDFSTFNREGILANYRGSPLPYSPKVTGNADAQYEWALSNGLKPFVGASFTYHGKDNSTFRNAAIPATAFAIKEYALVDLRAGISAADDSWRVTLFGHNVTNSFYWTGVTQASDTFARSAGRPVSYGITLAVKTR